MLDADTTGTSIQISFSNGVLTLSGSDTIEHYQQVLSTVTYQSTLADPTLNGSALDRQISWVLDDGQGGNSQSATETTMISFVPTVDNDASGTGTGFTTTYTENGAGIAIVDADIAITGGSNGLTSAQIVITDAVDGDSLEVGTLSGSIAASVDTSTPGQITLTLSGYGSAADYQQALQAITFQSTSDAPGDTRTIDITVSDGLSSSAVAATTIAITGVNDVHTGGGSITGTVTEDQILTAVSTMEDVDGIGALHYDWQRNTGTGFVHTGAADQATYTLGDADVGAVMRVTISYTDSQGFTEEVTTDATGVVGAVNDPRLGNVSITGTATEDQVLTADTSQVVDFDGLGTMHFDWQRDNGSGYVSIGAADQATYMLDDADVGSAVRVVVSYTDGQGFSETINSGATATIAGVNDPHTGGVSVTGTATEDQVLTADTSSLADIDGLGTLHYDWQRDTGSGFTSIGAADQATYTFGDADVGGTVRVVISYTDGQGFAEQATSDATGTIANVNDDPTGGVAISGTMTENEVLTADTSSLSDADGLGMLHYDWQRDSGPATSASMPPTRQPIRSAMPMSAVRSGW